MAVEDRIVIQIAAEYSDNTGGEFQKSAKSADKYCESVNKLKKQLDSVSKTKVRTNLEANDRATQVIDKVKDNINYLKNHKAQIPLLALDKASSIIESTKNKAMSLASKTFRFTVGVIDKATAPLQKIWNFAKSLKGIMTGIFAGAAAQKFVMKPAQMAIDRQNVTTAFENLLGSKEAATERVSDLTSFAGQTPFTRDEIFEASRVLQVFTGDALSTADGLKTVGDVASGTQQDFKEVAVWMGRLYSGMKAGQPIGEATARLQEMGAISGDSRVKLEALAKSGRDISETWPEATAEFAQFDGMMLKMSDGFQNLLLGAKSFVNNNVWQRIGAGIINGFTPALQRFRDWRSENKDLINEMANNIESGVTNIVSKVSGGVEKIFDVTSKLMRDDAFKNADFMGKAGMLWDQLIAEPFSSWWNGGGKDKVKEGVKNAANGIKDILIDVLGEAFELAFSNPITGTIATLYGAKYGINIGKGILSGVKTAKGAVNELKNIYKTASKIIGLINGTQAIPQMPYGVTSGAASTFNGAASSASTLSKAFSGIKSTSTLASAGVSTLASTIGTVAAVAIPIAVLSVAAYKKGVENIQAPMKDLIDKNAEIIESSKKLNEQVTQNTSAREASIESTAAEAEASRTLTDRLFNLVDQEGQTAVGKEKIKILVDELNEKLPELALSYDEESNSISASKDAIYDKIKAMEEEARTAAARDALTQAAADMLKLEEDRLALSSQLEDAEKRKAEAVAEAVRKYESTVGVMGESENRKQSMIQGTTRVYDEEIGKLNQALDENMRKQDEVSEHTDFLMDSITGNVTDGVGQAEQALKDGEEPLYQSAADTFSAPKRAADETAYGMYDSGLLNAQNYGSGLNDGAPDAESAGQNVSGSGENGVASKNSLFGEHGTTAGLIYAGALSNQDSFAAGLSLSEKGANGAGGNKELFRQKGESSGNSFFEGMKSALSGLGEWLQNLFNIEMPTKESVSGSNEEYFTKHADGGFMTRPHIGLVAEDGAESIIPLSPQRRSRGIALWQETGRRLGVMAYAEGGIVGQLESYPMAAGGGGAYTSSGAGGPSVSGGGGEAGRVLSFETGGLKEDLAEADQFFQEYSSNVLTAGLSTWDNLKNNVTSKTQEMNDTDRAKFDEFAQYFTTFGTGLVLTGAAAFDALKGGVVTKSTDTVKFGVSKFNEFSSYVGTLPPIFGGYGADMMSELAYGIESQRAAVLKSTSTLVQDLLSTFITGLGIHSPSKKMQWVGEMMAAGIIKGLSADQITQYVYYIIDQMQSSFSSGKLDVGTVVDKLDDNIPALVAKLGVDPKEAASLIYPLLGTAGTLTSVFGGRDAPTAGASTNHGGIDLAAPTGTQIAAVLGGLVTIAGEYGGYGNAVKIDHGNGVESLYGHMSAVGVAPGQQVTAGQVIGNVGSTGISTGPHLHLSMYKDGEAIDPLPYVQGAPIMAGNTLAGALMAEYNRRKFGIGAAGALGGGGDVASWIMQALAITGQSMDYLDELMYIAQMESGGDPNAINLWDSNAAAGHPSKGLMQTIDSTFAAYALPGYDDIWNPVHNAIAAIRYMNERYGGIQNHPGLGGRGYVGYAVGTREVPQDMLAVIHKDEAIFPAAQNPFGKSGGDMIADMVSNVLPFPEMESNSIRNEKGDFAERNNMIEFPERKSDTGQSTVGEAVPVVVPQSTAAGGVSVSINLGGISVSIEGSNAGTPQDIEALLRAQIPGIANDLCAQIAQKLTEILAGMPTRSEAV